jgi:hypothetical protein
VSRPISHDVSSKAAISNDRPASKSYKVEVRMLAMPDIIAMRASIPIDGVT